MGGVGGCLFRPFASFFDPKIRFLNQENPSFLEKSELLRKSKYKKIYMRKIKVQKSMIKSENRTFNPTHPGWVGGSAGPSPVFGIGVGWNRGIGSS